MAVVGEIIDGKYEILKLIGSGGMSKVYLAMDRRLNKQWAVKEITKRARDMNNEVVIQSAIAEANMIKKLDHPALPRIVDIIENGDMIFVIMDYIEGETLGSVLMAEGPQPQELVAEWALQLCEVLDYLHTRTPSIIYRDMKPDNIMLKPDGNIKLIDFGIAREYKEHKSSDTIGLGTRGYAAPEQFGGQTQTDARTDIYCLGMTLHHLLTGKNPSEPPYETYPVRHWNPQLSTGLEAVIQKCINLDPNKRYQSCAELAYALYHYDELSIEYIARQKSKLRVFFVSVAAMIICLGTGFIGMGMKNHEQNTTFEHYMEEAEKANTPEDKIRLYSEAIDVKPEDTRSYRSMINVCKEDDEFSQEEERVLRNKVDTNQVLLQADRAQYAELAFEIGKLYWYYLSYGSAKGVNDSDDENISSQAKGEIARTSAIAWFNDAVKYGSKNKMAQIYRDIGQADRERNVLTTEGNEKGHFKEYWNKIDALIREIKGSDEREVVLLEAYSLAENTIYTYAKKLKEDGISKDVMMKMHDSVRHEVLGIEASSEKTKKLKRNMEERFGENGGTDKILERIEEAFSVKEGPRV